MAGALRTPESILPGEGLLGQCALEKKRILVSNVAPDFLSISSSLGEAKRVNIIVLPVLFEGQIKAVIELASLHPLTVVNITFLEQLTLNIGAVFNTIEATMRTEGLLKQSQQLTAELQARQAELQNTNEQLGTKAQLLAEQNAEVERKSAEVEQARYALEEKAAELALTSKYKSEFLANMSHELRTPLNSILILSQQLAENSPGNLSGKQIEFSRNINSSGSDLLNLINDILDLSKIESGTVTVDVEEIPFVGLRENIDRNFRHVAEAKNLPFNVWFADDLPRSMTSDPKRLQQILKNLLSNAVKFTSHGHVDVRVSLAAQGRWTPIMQSSARPHPRSWLSPLRIPVSASPLKSSDSSLRRSSRRTLARHGSMGAPAWAWRSAANLRCCSAVKSSWRACMGKAAHSRCSCRCTISAPARCAGSRRPRRVGALPRRIASRA